MAIARHGSVVQTGAAKIYVRIGSRSYYSPVYFAAAVRNAVSAFDLERRGFEGIGSDRGLHLQHVMTAIMMAAASIEALVNELFSDAADNHEQRTPTDIARRSALKTYWEGPGGKKPLIDKYRAALRIFERPLSKADEPWIAFDVLIELRNWLLHFKPFTSFNDLPGENDRVAKIESYLSSRVEPNGLLCEGNVFFPDRCLGYGCAEWSVETARSIIVETKNATGWVSVMPDNVYSEILSRGKVR